MVPRIPQGVIGRAWRSGGTARNRFSGDIRIAIMQFAAQLTDQHESFRRLDLEELEERAASGLMKQIDSGCGEFWRAAEAGPVRMWSYVRVCTLNAALAMLKLSEYRLTRVSHMEAEAEAATRVADDLDDDIAILKALAGLPENQRVVVGMRIIDGKTYKQISEITGVNVNTLRSRMLAARKALLGGLGDASSA